MNILQDVGCYVVEWASLPVPGRRARMPTPQEGNFEFFLLDVISFNAMFIHHRDIEYTERRVKRVKIRRLLPKFNDTDQIIAFCKILFFILGILRYDTWLCAFA